MMRRRLSALLAILMILTFPVSVSAYSNPFQMPDSWKWNNGDFYGEGDPFILKFNGTYYLYASTVDDKAGVKVWSSDDLIHWEYRGLCTTEPATKAAYAPEVVYWNGDFYMYTSPAGQGHIVLKSSSPLGPFTVQTGNKGMGIDGHVFIDDDGQWYFYSTGSGQIDARPMTDPYTFGARSDTGAQMNGWTEGPTVIKRNGKYYMTYTGNHVWSKGYRVDYGVSSNPTKGFAADLYQNPVLIQTEGSNVGLGHNSIVRGPDLDSDYIVYHSHANPGRRVNLDRIVWNGDKMVVLGPTTMEQPNPDLPDFSDRFRRDTVGDAWITNGGTWGIREEGVFYQKELGAESWSLSTSKQSTGPAYTAEFNMRQVEQGDSDNPLYGAIFSYKDERNYGAAVFNAKNNRLETFFVENGEEKGRQTAQLPVGYDYSKWHQIRIEKAKSEIRVYVDGMLKQTRTDDVLQGGSVGYATFDTRAEFGYVAFSNKVNGSGAFTAYKPVPGKIEAVHANENVKDSHDWTNSSLHPEGGYYVSGLQGKKLSYSLLVGETGNYDLVLRYAAGADAKLKIELDGSDAGKDKIAVPSTGGKDHWDNFVIKGLKLSEGKQTIRLQVSGGAIELYELKFVRSVPTENLTYDFNDGNDRSWSKFDQNWLVETDGPSPFDRYKPIPGSIEAPYYNYGGEGVGYHETTPENIGGAFRGDSVDIRSNSFNAFNVGWNQTGEWLKYNVEVKQAGLYNFELTTATTFNGTLAKLWLDDSTDLTGVMDLPNTGDWNNWRTTVKQGIYLPEGRHTIKLETVKGEFDFARLNFTSFEVPKPIPGFIEAVHYNSGGEGVGFHDNTPQNIGGKYRNDAVDIRDNPEGGWNVGWNQTGEWLKYNVDIAKTGTYDVNVRVATALNGGKLRLWLDDDTDITGVVDVPNTGDWNRWQDVTIPDAALPAGVHTLKVEIVQGEYDLAGLSFFQFDEFKPLPGTIFATDYNTGGEGVAYHDTTEQNIGREFRHDAVDKRIHPEGGYNVGWNQTGEWLKYNVHVGEAGTYNLDLKVATALDGAKVRLWLDDQTDLTGVIEVPNTGGFDIWSTVTAQGIALPQGNHTIKVETVQGEFDFYSFRFHQDEIVPAQREFRSSAVGSFAKAVTGDAGLSDYTVESDIKLTGGTGNAGILFRVNNPANGLDWGQHNADFLQGYIAFIDASGVHLGKFNYGWQYLEGSAMNIPRGEWQHVKVVAEGTNVKVYVGDMNTPKIDYNDRSGTAFTHGKVGVRSFMSQAAVDNFTVKPNEVEK